MMNKNDIVVKSRIIAVYPAAVGEKFIDCSQRPAHIEIAGRAVELPEERGMETGVP